MFERGRDICIPIPLDTSATPLRLRWMDSGDVMMKPTGASSTRPRPGSEFEVHLSNGFWIGCYEITQAQWQAVVGNNPSFQAGLDLPVEQIDWHDALSFCCALNNSFARSLPSRYEFDLPSQAEWELCCRASSRSTFCNGDSVESLNEVAWFELNSDGKTHAVGQKCSNAFELFDMHGNVEEWCRDDFCGAPAGRVVDWVGTDGMGDYGNCKVVRGGSYGATPMICASSYVGYMAPNTRVPWIGFRLALHTIHDHWLRESK